MRKYLLFLLLCFPLHAQTTVNGNYNFTGTNYTCSQNTILYVGGPITCWSGSDIGAQINSAYTALPASGGMIFVLQPSTAGTCYNFSTPILFTTSNKAVRLVGLGPSNQTPQGACLNYTPTTATIAITADYMTSSGSAYAIQQGFEGITLTNNGCTTNGGCGSSATGIQAGTSSGGGNFGMLLGEIKNCKISGFGTGFNVLSTGSWGEQFLDSSIVWNTVGIQGSGQEEIKFIGGTIAVNGTGITGPFEIAVTNTSIDSNTTVGVTNSSMSGMTFTGTAIHWENLGVSNAHYISGNVNGTVYGGEVLDDNTMGTTAYLFESTALALDFDGVIVNNSGQTITGIFQADTVGANGFVRFLPSYTTSLTTVTGSNVANIEDFSLGIGATRLTAKMSTAPLQVNRVLQSAASNLAGVCTLGTNCGITFGTAYTSAPSCVGTDTTAANAVRANTSNTGVTFTGTGTDVINWICIGNPN